MLKLIFDAGPLITACKFHAEGEQEALGLMHEDGFQDALLVVDDHLVYLVSDRLRVPKLFLLDLIVRLVKEQHLTVALGRGMVEAICTRYPQAFIKHTLWILEQGISR